MYKGLVGAPRRVAMRPSCWAREIPWPPPASAAALSGSYFGYFTRGCAAGVGESTKNAVVLSSILILFFNVVINLVLM
jgi:hypothetical protein